MQPLRRRLVRARRVPGARAGTRYKFRIDGEIEVPDPASHFQPDDVHGPSEVIDHGLSTGRRADWTRPAVARVRLPRAACRHLHAGRHLSRRHRQARSHRGDGHHRDRADAGRRFLRPLELGLRRRAALCAGQRLWPARRPEGADRRRPPARPDGVSRRRLQSLRAGGKLSRPLCAAVLHAGRTRRGATPSTTAAGGARASRSRTRCIGSSDYRFDGLRLDAVHAIAEPGRTVAARRAQRSRRRRSPRRPARHIHLVLENDDNQASLLDPRRRSAAREIPRAVERRLSPRLARAADRRDRGLLRRLSRSRAASSRARSPRASPIRASRRRTAAASARGEPSVGICRPRRSSISCRTTTRSATARSASGCRRWRRPRRSRRRSPSRCSRRRRRCCSWARSGARAQPFPFFCDFKGDLAEAVREGRRKEFAEAYAQHRDEDVPDPLAEQTCSAGDARLGGGRQAAASGAARSGARLLAARKRSSSRACRSFGPAMARAKFDGDGAVARWRFASGEALSLLANLERQARSRGPQACAGQASRSGAARRRDALPPWAVSCRDRSRA